MTRQCPCVCFITEAFPYKDGFQADLVMFKSVSVYLPAILILDHVMEYRFFKLFFKDKFLCHWLLYHGLIFFKYME